MIKLRGQRVKKSMPVHLMEQVPQYYLQDPGIFAFVVTSFLQLSAMI